MSIAYVGIDNGHGKNTPGKRVPDDSMREWDFNYATAKHLNEELKYNNFKTIMVSDTSEDTPLKTRTNRVNNAKADIFVSIHANAYLGTWGDAHGIETFAYKSGTKGDKLAKLVQEELIGATGLTNRGVKYNNLHITRESTMPAILCECGFMDNKNEAALLKTDAYRKKCAKAICKGICKYFGVTYKDKDDQKDENIPSTDPNMFYRVVSGSYLNKDLANDEVNRLKKDNIDTFLDIFEKDSKKYYRIIAGSYNERKNANEQLEFLKSKGYDAFIVVYEKK